MINEYQLNICDVWYNICVVKNISLLPKLVVLDNNIVYFWNIIMVWYFFQKEASLLIDQRKLYLVLEDGPDIAVLILIWIISCSSQGLVLWYTVREIQRKLHQLPSRLIPIVICGGMRWFYRLYSQTQAVKIQQLFCLWLLSNYILKVVRWYSMSAVPFF